MNRYPMSCIQYRSIPMRDSYREATGRSVGAESRSKVQCIRFNLIILGAYLGQRFCCKTRCAPNAQKV